MSMVILCARLHLILCLILNAVFRSAQDEIVEMALKDMGLI